LSTLWWLVVVALVHLHQPQVLLLLAVGQAVI
jgi:hypothetical protein